MSKIKEQQLVKEIDYAALTLWARMVMWLENTNDRLGHLEARIKELEKKEVKDKQ